MHPYFRFYYERLMAGLVLWVVILVVWGIVGVLR